MIDKEKNANIVEIWIEEMRPFRLWAELYVQRM